MMIRKRRRLGWQVKIAFSLHLKQILLKMYIFFFTKQKKEEKKNEKTEEKETEEKSDKENEAIFTRRDFLKDFKKFDPDKESGKENKEPTEKSKKDVVVTLTSKVEE